MCNEVSNHMASQTVVNKYKKNSTSVFSRHSSAKILKTKVTLNTQYYRKPSKKAYNAGSDGTAFLVKTIWKISYHAFNTGRPTTPATRNQNQGRRVQ